MKPERGRFQSVTSFFDLPTLKLYAPTEIIVSVVILSAGREPIQEDTPKCLMDIGGLSLLERTVSQIRKQNQTIPIVSSLGTWRN